MEVQGSERFKGFRVIKESEKLRGQSRSGVKVVREPNSLKGHRGSGVRVVWK